MARTLKRIGAVLGYGLGALVLAFGIVFGALQTAPAKGYVLGLLVRELSEPGLAELSVGRLTGFFPLHNALLDVRLADGKGVWLSGERIAFDLAARDLVQGRFLARNAVAEGVRVTRLPNAPSGAAAGTPVLLAWPENVTLEHFLFPDIRLDSALAGEPLLLSAEGHVRPDRAAGASAAVDIRGLEGTRGLAKLHFERSAADERMTLEVDASEPEGGILARHLGLSGAPAFALRLRGDGTLAEWHASMEGGFAGLASLAADLALKRGETVGLALEGRADLAAAVDPAIAPLLSQGIRFAAEARWQPPGVVDVQRLDLSLDETTLLFSGAFDPKTLFVAGEVSVSANDLGRFETLLGATLGGRLHLKGRVEGPLRRPSADFDASIEKPALADLQAQSLVASLRLEPKDRKGGFHFDGEGRLEGFAPEEETARLLLGPMVHWSVAGETGGAGPSVSIEALEVGGEALSFIASGDIGEGGRRVAGKIEARLDDLDRLAPLLGFSLGGEAAFSADLTADLSAETVAGSVSAKVSRPKVEEPVVQALLGAELSAFARLALDPDRTLRVDALELESGPTSLSGRGRLSEAFSKLVAEVAIDSRDLSLLSPALGIPLAGRMKADGEFEGPIDGPSGSFEFAVQDVEVGSIQVDRLAGTATVREPSKRPSGSLLADAEFHGRAITLSTGYALDAGNNLRLSDLVVASGEGSLSGDVSVALATGLIEGSVAGEVGELAPLMELAGEQIRGTARFEARFSSSNARQDVDLTIEARRVRGADLGDLRADVLSIEGHVSDVFEQPQGTLLLAAQGVRAGGALLSNLSLSAEGTSRSFAFEAMAEGSRGAPFALQADGDLSLAEGPLRIALKNLEASYAGLPVTLRRELALALGDREVSFDGLDASVGTGRVKGSGSIKDDRLDGRVGLEYLPLSTVSIWIPEIDLGGRLSGQILLDGTVRQPRARVSLRAEDLGIRDADLPATPALAGTLEALWEGERVELEGSVSGLVQTALTFEAIVPLVLASEPLTITVPGSGPLSGLLEGTGEIAPIAELFPLGANRFAGEFALTVHLSGSVGDPQLAGSFNLSNGQFDNFFAGTVLREVEIDLTGDGRRLVLNRLKATDGEEGILAAEGSMSLERGSGSRFEVAATLEEVALARRDELTARATGRLVLTGDPDAARLAGGLIVTSAEVRIPERLSGDVVTLEVEEIDSTRPGAPESAERSTAAEARKTAPLAEIALDVRVDMPRRVFVRQRGLDSEWKGSFHVTGTSAKPLIEGTLTLARGRFAFLTRTFALRRGTVVFQGESPPDPSLDIVAEAKAKEVLARLLVRGRASSPELALESEPFLPSDEILARLLFGKGTAAMSAAEAAQLAAATASLAGGGPDVMGNIRQALGLDQLIVSGTGEGEAGPKVGVGKYVGEDVFISVEQGLDEQSGRVNVEVELAPTITLESEVGADARSNVWMNWKLPY